MIATIGYERASLVDFIATLKLSDVDLVVDIRDRAQSRRAGFSKTALSGALEASGIGYLHLRELGDPKEGREAARRGDLIRFRSIYDNVMQTSKAKEAIAYLEELALENKICLMCYERDQVTCHRTIVADRLVRNLGTKARHLGVREGAGTKFKDGRVCNTDQSSAAQIQYAF